MSEWEHAWADSTLTETSHQDEESQTSRQPKSPRGSRTNVSLILSLLKGEDDRAVRFLLAYTCVGITSRKLGEIIEKYDASQRAAALDEEGAKFRCNDFRLSWIERQTGKLSSGTKQSNRKRIKYLTVLYQSLGEHSSSGQPTLSVVRRGLAALGEHLSLTELNDYMISTGELEFDELDLVKFLKLMGSLDAAGRGVLISRRRKRRVLPNSSLVDLAVLFIELDRDLSGLVSCCGLAATIRDVSDDDSIQSNLYRKLAHVVSKSLLRDTDCFDFDEFVRFTADFVVGKSKKNIIANEKKIDTRGVPWAALFAEFLPIGKSTLRANAFKHFLTIVSEKQQLLLLSTTRDGSNLLHYVAERGDTEASKLLLAMPHIRMMVCEKNHAGLHPPAIAFLACNDECEKYLRSWMGYALDAKMRHKAERHRRLYAISASSQQQQQNMAVRSPKKSNPHGKTTRQKRRQHAKETREDEIEDNKNGDTS